MLSSDIEMGYKGLHALSSLPFVHPHASTAEFLALGTPVSLLPGS